MTTQAEFFDLCRTNLQASDDLQKTTAIFAEIRKLCKESSTIDVYALDEKKTSPFIRWCIANSQDEMLLSTFDELPEEAQKSYFNATSVCEAIATHSSAFEILFSRLHRDRVHHSKLVLPTELFVLYFREAALSKNHHVLSFFLTLPEFSKSAKQELIRFITGAGLTHHEDPVSDTTRTQLLNFYFGLAEDGTYRLLAKEDAAAFLQSSETLSELVYILSRRQTPMRLWRKYCFSDVFRKLCKDGKPITDEIFEEAVAELNQSTTK